MTDQLSKLMDSVGSSTLRNSWNISNWSGVYWRCLKAFPRRARRKIRCFIAGDPSFSCIQTMCTGCARTSDCAMLKPFWLVHWVIWWSRFCLPFAHNWRTIVLVNSAKLPVCLVVRWWGLASPISIAFWLHLQAHCF